MGCLCKDKDSEELSSVCHYSTLHNQSLFCPICKKMGHLAKNCQSQKKSHVCVLCGIQGHLQKDCPRQLCSRCGLLSHGFRACNRPPVWNQHCQRCGLMGHVTDICPDTWRQYHYITTTVESPRKIQTFHTINQKKRPAYCYNCSRRGHYGHECSLKRMISGTFFTLPYVCHYDCTDTALQDRIPSRKIEHTNETTSLAEQKQSCETFENICSKNKDSLFQGRTKAKQKAQASGRKTWPERRRERQEIKKLRREAQARREGGLMGQCQLKPDDENDNYDILYLDPFATSKHLHYTSPPRSHSKHFVKETKLVERHKENVSKEKC
ncbi:hypothetical protein WMY93_008979 [Mugilogobius chulae]|uniref:Zinc finger CCHC domain-containing protein 7 n=1 Tax=Mugilogobius chulae TaxID=88201 RepID=A0AAW0PFE6_9GOBI